VRVCTAQSREVRVCTAQCREVRVCTAQSREVRVCTVQCRQTFRCFVLDVQTDAGWYFKRMYECCNIRSDSLCNQVIRRCKTWINNESLKTQRIDHPDQFTIWGSSMFYPKLFTYSVALWPSGGLGALNYGYSFFPIDCRLSPYPNLHLPQILLQNFQSSRSRSYPSSVSHQFTLGYCINWPSLTNSYTSNLFQYFWCFADVHLSIILVIDQLNAQILIL